ncbi:MAG: N-acetylglucosamine transferase [Rhodobacteraceae bacterium]|nr:MAG: N-acetylglucosamine transferase [Paracoccaceae bacterium]
MLRKLHKYFALTMTVVILVLSLSGLALSVIPAWDKIQSPPQLETELNVAVLAARISSEYPEVEQIKRAPSGRITAYYFSSDNAGAVVIDPATGKGLRDYETFSVVQWLTHLHRAFLIGDSGRLVAAAGALAMFTLSVSGVFLLARRLGGWRRLFARSRGSLAGRLHVDIGRFSALGLIMASVTALFMSLNTFEILPQERSTPAFPANVSGELGFDPADMPALAAIPVSELRSLGFPYANDPTDVFTIRTDRGEGYIDQGNGDLLAWKDAGPWQKLFETIYMLHTGQGAWALGLLMGLMVLGVPIMAVSGLVIWWIARRSRPKMPKNAAAAKADTVILVGSEGGSTWGFAATLQKALVAKGHAVHAAPMSRFNPKQYSHAKQILVLAATYGDGTAPASAKGFIEKLAALETPPSAKVSVLGFGDRQFPAYCAFANLVAAEAAKKGWQELLPFETVDSQSPQDFARWGINLGKVLGHDLELAHEPARPRTHQLTLISRREYGIEVQAPTVILRFALPRAGILARLQGKGFKRFSAGDLLGVVPQGASVARLYSLASGTRDGFVEICVRKHAHGLCSGQLLGLKVGDSIEGFIRSNPEFSPARGKKPVILIGAGTGIGPLAGFARANARKRPMHLYFGIRHAESDLLYGAELEGWQQEGNLDSVNIACSRTDQRTYVQDMIRRDGAAIATLIEEGAQVLVCGGREMAAGVAHALNDILMPHGLSPIHLKAEGRYVEDVY